MDLFLFGFFLGFSQSRKVNEAGESGLAVASDGLIGVSLVGPFRLLVDAMTLFERKRSVRHIVAGFLLRHAVGSLTGSDPATAHFLETGFGYLDVHRLTLLALLTFWELALLLRGFLIVFFLFDMDLLLWFNVGVRKF